MTKLAQKSRLFHNSSSIFGLTPFASTFFAGITRFREKSPALSVRKLAGPPQIAKNPRLDQDLPLLPLPCPKTTRSPALARPPRAPQGTRRVRKKGFPRNP